MHRLLQSTVRTLSGNGRCCVRDGPTGESSLAYPRQLVPVPASSDLLVADNCPSGFRLAGAIALSTLSFANRSHMQFEPASMAFNPLVPNQLIFSDPTHHKLRKMNTLTLEQTVLAGHGSGHRDGFLTEALFKAPKALAFACDGRILVVGDQSGCLRCVDFENGQVTTLAGKPGSTNILKVNSVYKMNEVSFGAIAKVLVSKTSPGVIYVVDQAQHCIVTVDTAKETCEVLIGTPGRPGRSVVDGVAQLSSPSSACEMEDGTLVICDTGNQCLRVVNPSTRACEVLTSTKRGWVDGVITQAQFNDPVDIVYFQKQLFVTDKNNHVIRVVKLYDGEDVENVQELKNQRMDDSVVEFSYRFRIYCKQCQQLTSITQDHTCTKCGSLDIVVYDDAKNREKLHNEVIFKANEAMSSPSIFKSKSAQNQQQAERELSFSQSDRSPSNNSGLHFSAMHVDQSFHKPTPDFRSLEIGSAAESVLNRSLSSKNRLKILDRTGAEKVEASPILTGRMQRSELEQSRLSFGAMAGDANPRPQPQRFQEEFQLDGEIFDELCAEFELKDLQRDLQTCRQYDFFTELVEGRIPLHSALHFQQEAERFAPLLVVQASEGPKHFPVPLPVNKLDGQFCTFVDAAATSVVMQVSAQEECVDFYIKLGGPKPVYFNSFAVQNTKVMETGLKTKVFRAQLQQVLPFCTQTTSEYEAHVVAAFASGRRDAFRVRFGVGRARPAGWPEFANVAVLKGNQ